MKKKKKNLLIINNELLIKNKIFGTKILGKGKLCYNLAKLLGQVGLIINGLRFYSPGSF